MTTQMKDNLFSTIVDYPSQYYLYTNNNLARNYFSLDSITCLSCMENNDILISLGSYLHDALIISDNPLSSKVINKLIRSEDNAYSICLGLSIDTRLSTSIPAFLVDNDYKITWSNLSEYTSKKHMLAIIVGSIPFSYVNKVVFKTEEECTRFNFTFSNIHNPSDIYIVDEILFNDDNDVDVHILEERYFNYIDENKIDLNPALECVKVRNKYKGMYAGALFGLSKMVGKYKFHGDASILEYFKFDSSTRKKLLANILIDFFPNSSERDKKELTDLLVNNEDNSPFIHLSLILESLPCDYLEIRRIVDNLKFTIKNDRDDLLLFIIVLKVILETKTSKNFSASENITSIIEKLRIVMDDDDESMKTIIMGLYFIQKNILNDFADISEVLSIENDAKIRSIRAYMVFAKSPLFSDFEKLVTSVDSFPINEYESRLVWMFYGALHGMTAFGKKFKESPHINRIADEYTLKFTNSPYLVKDVPTYEEMQSYRKIGDKLIYSGNGYPLNPEIQFSKEEKESEKIRNILINCIDKNNKQQMKVISTKLLKSKAKFKGYSFTVIYTFSKDKASILSENEKTIKVSSKMGAIIEDVDLRDMYTNLFTSDEKFLDSYRINKDLWLDIEKKIKSKKTNG